MVYPPLIKTHPVKSIFDLRATVVVRRGHTIEAGLAEHTPVIVSVHHLPHIPCIVTLEEGRERGREWEREGTRVGGTKGG